MRGETTLVSLLILLIGLVLAGPILAIVALIRLRRLENQIAELRQTDPQLVARIYALEQKPARADSRPEAPAEQPQAAEVRAVTDSPLPSLPQPKQTSFDLEKLIAGRVLMRVGMLLVLIGVAYFLRYAFDNNWIGPAGRVTLGLLAGTALLVLSNWQLKRGYVYFSEGITALGAGILYLSLYAAWSLYALMPNAAAFLLMIAITGALLAIAVGRGSQRLAVLGLIGGFLTPMLVSTGRNAQIELFTYLAALDTGLLVITRLRPWRILEPLAFACTQIYFWGWYSRFYHSEPQLLTTMIFAAVFFLLFASMPAIRSRRTVAALPDHVAVMLLNTFLYLGALRALLWPDRRWTLTIAVLTLSALHLGATKYISRRDSERPLAYLLYAGLALMFVTLAIPIRLEGRWITMAWAIEGAVLVWSGFRGQFWLLRSSGLLLFLLTLVRLAAFPVPADRFFFNSRFGVYAVTIACFALALWSASKNAAAIKTAETQAYKALATALNLVTFTALSQEAYLLFTPAGGATISAQAELMRQVALTAYWAVHAAIAFAAGLLRRIAGLRIQAYVLLAATAVKFFIMDSPQAWSIHYSLALFNPRFIGFAIIAAAFMVIAFVARKHVDDLENDEQAVLTVLGVITNAMAVVALSLEVWDFFQPSAEAPDGRDDLLARQLGLSLLWTGYATFLIATGVRRRFTELRYQGLALFAITIIKVFFFDLGFLAGFYRIVSSLALGVVLLVVAFLYQKFVIRESVEGTR
jgi:uncharacterized membrane protein